MATLTIADLDNGKRDLQTVDGVANSRAASVTTRYGQQTTTLYESIRRINATGDQQLAEQQSSAEAIIHNLGYFVPVDYAPGLSVTEPNFTVVGPDGKIYAAQAGQLPFTTGAWNPGQWYPIQNVLNDHKLLVFETLVEAQAAAATLPDGQVVDVEGEEKRYTVEAGSLVFFENFLRRDLAGAGGSALVGYDGGTAQDVLDGLKPIANYIALRAYTGRATGVRITASKLAGYFAHDASDTTSADNGGTLIVGTDGRRWKRIYGGHLRVGWFGAVGDGVTDDTAAINSTATAARALKTSIYLAPVAASYKVSASIDFSYINVYGGGRASLIQATAAQFDVVTTSGNSTLKDFAIHGGWDGTTAGQLGDGLVIRNSVSQWAYNVHVKGLFIQYCKRNLTTVQYGGYSSLRSIKANACGRHGLEILGASGDATTTTVMVDGTCTYSDCPYGFSYRIENGIDITLLGAIGEYSKGIEIAGNDNRNINLVGVYQENISTGNFLTLTGSGMGLVIHGCFGVGLTLPYSANFYDVSIQGNTGFAENGMERNGRSLFVDGGEQTTTTADTFNGGFVSVPVGTWIISGTVQTIDASPGATINKVGVRASLSQTDSAWVANTNASFVEDIDMRHVSSGAAGRASVRFMYSNKTGVPQIMYLRAFVGVTAGTVAFRGVIRAEKV